MKQLGKILRKSFRLTDLVARYGGEEFVVLLDDVLIEGAEKAAMVIGHIAKSALTSFSAKPFTTTVLLSNFAFKNELLTREAEIMIPTAIIRDAIILLIFLFFLILEPCY